MSQTINKTSPVTPVLADLIAIWQTANSDTRNCSLSALLTLFQENLDGSKPTTQYSSPGASDFDIEILNTGANVHLILMPTGAFAVGAITLPASPVDKQTVLVNITTSVASFTVNSSKTVVGAPTVLAADDFFTLKYDLVFDTWYRVG